MLQRRRGHIGHTHIRNRGRSAAASPTLIRPRSCRRHAGPGGRSGHRGPRGGRTIAPMSLVSVYYATALEPDELLEEVRIAAAAASTGWAFEELSRRHGDFALVGVAALVTMDDGAIAGRVWHSRASDRPRCARRPPKSCWWDSGRTQRLFPRGGRAGEPSWTRKQTSMRRRVSARSGRRPDAAGAGAASERAVETGGPPLPLGEGWGEGVNTRSVQLTVNGRDYERSVEPRMLLSDFIRDDLGLTGTHVGCEHGVCGACTVLWDGEPVRSCLVFAVQAQGASIRTVESLAPSDVGAASDPGGVYREARPAMRLLHARHAPHGGGVAARQPEPDRAGDPRGHQRKPVPLHGLPQHRARRAARRREAVSSRLRPKRGSRASSQRCVVVVLRLPVNCRDGTVYLPVSCWTEGGPRARIS